MVILPARSDCICTTGWQESNAERRKMFRRERTLTLEPLFRKEGLRGSGYYYEYRTDDARLTVEVMKSARAKGAHRELCQSPGIHVSRRKSSRSSSRRPSEWKDLYDKRQKIINAAGPWVDQVRLKDNSLKGKRLLLTKGVHLVVDHAKLPIRQVLISMSRVAE